MSFNVILKKNTITDIESILGYSEAVYKYGKNEGSYHSRTLLVVEFYAARQIILGHYMFVSFQT